MLTLEMSVRKAQGLHSAKVSESETVLLTEGGDDYLGLSGVSARIWDLLGEETAIAPLVRQLAQEYEAPEAEIAGDVLDFLNGLIDAGALTAGE